MVKAGKKFREIKMSDYDITIIENIMKQYGWEEDRNGYISKEAAV